MAQWSQDSNEYAAYRDFIETTFFFDSPEWPIQREIQILTYVLQTLDARALMGAAKLSQLSACAYRVSCIRELGGIDKAAIEKSGIKKATQRGIKIANQKLHIDCEKSRLWDLRASMRKQLGEKESTKIEHLAAESAKTKFVQLLEASQKVFGQQAARRIRGDRYAGLAVERGCSGSRISVRSP